MNTKAVHCVYPKPGATVESLPGQWRPRALEILRDWTATHGQFRGCCCGSRHERLIPDDVGTLEGAGFVVQLWSEEGC